MSNADRQALIASSRFGLLERDLSTIRTDPQQWLLGQVGKVALIPQAKLDQHDATDKDLKSGEVRRLLRKQLAIRWQAMIDSQLPFQERLAMFWANHFTVSARGSGVASLIIGLENKVIRPQINGQFGDLCKGVMTHPAMLLYLDNSQSTGPQSLAGKKRNKGLNENLARELLELHTLGVKGGYTQDDVMSLAAILSGWSVKREDDTPQAYFNERMHQPGTKKLMGKTYPEGPDALGQVIDDLARHPSTAQHVSFKLAQYFVMDTPPDALVKALAQAYLKSDGRLGEVYKTLIQHPLAWQSLPAQARKVRKPEDWMLAVHRLLSAPLDLPLIKYKSLLDLGQPYGLAPSPAGWAESGQVWLNSNALTLRLAYSDELSEQLSDMALPQLIDKAFGQALDATTREELGRASSGNQMLRLIMMSPDLLLRA